VSAWEEWKKNLGESRIWHLLDPEKTIEDKEVINKRMEICRSCDFFIPLTQQCKKCGCIMTFKTKLAGAGCPINKWGQHND
jgi:hypothetical protein